MGIGLRRKLGTSRKKNLFLETLFVALGIQDETAFSDYELRAWW
jgi:hypothetical protein